MPLLVRRLFSIHILFPANDTTGYSTGIGLVTAKLRPRQQFIGLPKPSLYIGANCKNLIFEIEQYKYPEEKKDRNPSEIPIKENDHGPDALRYFALHMKFGMQKDDKLPKNSLIKSLNQYGF